MSSVLVFPLPWFTTYSLNWCQHFFMKSNSCLMSSYRSWCRAILCAGQCGESLRSVLHLACAQWDQQPSFHMAFQDKGRSLHQALPSIYSSVNTCTWKANKLCLANSFCHSLFIGWLLAWLPHGEPYCHEPAPQQHLQSGGGATCSLRFVKYSLTSYVIHGAPV